MNFQQLRTCLFSKTRQLRYVEHYARLSFALRLYPIAIHNASVNTFQIWAEAVAHRRNEKYAHVTYFSARREQPYPGEDRILVPSPKVATYTLNRK